MCDPERSSAEAASDGVPRVAAGPQVRPPTSQQGEANPKAQNATKDDVPANAPNVPGEPEEDDDDDAWPAGMGGGLGEMMLALLAGMGAEPGVAAQNATERDAAANVPVVRPRPSGQMQTRSHVEQVVLLSAKQERAMEMILQGATDAGVAAALGVHRATLSKWRNHHAGFKAEMSRRRREVWDAVGDGVRVRLPLALQAIDEHLQSADPKLRLRGAALLLRLAGRNQFAPPDEPVDVAGLLDNLVKQRQADRAAGGRELSVEARVAEHTAVLEEMRRRLRGK